MALKKYSAFYYGHTITGGNAYINFVEPNVSATEIATTIDIGSYTLTQFGSKISQALNSGGTLDYEVTLDRATRSFTISANDTFDLLIDTGANSGVSAFSLMGFEGNDLTGSNIYTGTASGSAYVTQYPLQKYTSFDKYEDKAEVSVKETPGGITEVISFATIQRMKCDFVAITDYVPQRAIRETATGVDEFLAFVRYANLKAPLEFVEIFDEPANYIPCIIDRATGSANGVGYELKETRKLPGYFDFKGVVFKRIEVENG